MLTYKKWTKEKLQVLKDHRDNIFNHIYKLKRMVDKVVKMFHKNNKNKLKKTMPGHRNHQWIEMEINHEEVNNMMPINLKQRFKSNWYLKIILESKRTQMLSRLWTQAKLI